MSDWFFGFAFAIFQFLFSVKMFYNFFCMMKDLTALEWRYFFYAFLNGFVVSICYYFVYTFCHSKFVCDNASSGLAAPT